MATLVNIDSDNQYCNSTRTVRSPAQFMGAVWSWREAIALRDAAEPGGEPTHLAKRLTVAQVGRAPMYFARGRIKS
jgi:hypothetical protein